MPATLPQARHTFSASARVGTFPFTYAVWSATLIFRSSTGRPSDLTSVSRAVARLDRTAGSLVGAAAASSAPKSFFPAFITKSIRPMSRPPRTLLKHKPRDLATPSGTILRLARAPTRDREEGCPRTLDARRHGPSWPAGTR